MAIFSLNQFYYNPVTRTLSVEASELSDFSFDKNIQIQSHKTGKIALFVRDHARINGDDDLEYVEYITSEPSISKLIVYND